VVQDDTNALGAADNSGANAAVKAFSINVGVPPLQITSPAAIAPGPVTVAAAPGTFAQISVGQVLTLAGGTPNAENVTVTAVDQATTRSRSPRRSRTPRTIRSPVRPRRRSVRTTAHWSPGSAPHLQCDDRHDVADGAGVEHRLGASGHRRHQHRRRDAEPGEIPDAYQAAAKTLNVIESLLTTAIALIPTPA